MGVIKINVFSVDVIGKLSERWSVAPLTSTLRGVWLNAMVHETKSETKQASYKWESNLWIVEA